MSNLKISLFRNGREDFIAILNEKGIIFQEIHPPIGMIMASASAIDIIHAIGNLTIIKPLCDAFVKWMDARASREIHVTLVDNKIVYMRGYSANQACKIMMHAKSIAVIQTDSDDRPAIIHVTPNDNT